MWGRGLMRMIGVALAYDVVDTTLSVHQIILAQFQKTVLKSMAFDAEGKIVAVGQAGISAGAQFFAVKMNTSGDEMWTQNFGTDKEERLNSLALDAAGDIYAVGDTEGSLSGGTDAGTKTSDCVAFKLSGETGEVVWHKQFGTDREDVLSAVAVHAGNVYAVGDTDGTLTNSSGGMDFIAVRFSGDGSVVWQQQFGTADTDYLFGIALNADGDIYAVGETSGILPGETTMGSYDFAAMKLRGSDGTLVWARQFGTSGRDILYAVVLDAAGDLYAVGETSGTLPITNVTNAGDDGTPDFAAVKLLGETGEVVWMSQFGSAKEDSLHCVTLDGAGDVYAAGHTKGRIVGVGMAGFGGSDYVLMKFDGRDGTLLWKTQFGTSGADSLKAFALRDGAIRADDGTVMTDVYAVGTRNGKGVAVKFYESTPSPTPVPTPKPTPEPTPSPTPEPVPVESGAVPLAVAVVLGLLA